MLETLCNYTDIHILYLCYIEPDHLLSIMKNVDPMMHQNTILYESHFLGTYQKKGEKVLFHFKEPQKYFIQS